MPLSTIEDVGAPLLELSIISLVVGIAYLLWAEIRAIISFFRSIPSFFRYKA